LLARIQLVGGPNITLEGKMKSLLFCIRWWFLGRARLSPVSPFGVFHKLVSLFLSKLLG
jgi:hypothetical protein